MKKQSIRIETVTGDETAAREKCPESKLRGLRREREWDPAGGRAQFSKHNSAELLCSEKMGVVVVLLLVVVL